MKYEWEVITIDAATVTERLLVQDGWLVRVLMLSLNQKSFPFFSFTPFFHGIDMVFVPDSAHVWEIPNDN